MPHRSWDVDAEVVGPLEWRSLRWFARLSQDGPFIGCRRCGEGTIWGLPGDGGKVGMHPRCVPAAIASGLLNGTSASSEPVAPRVEVDDAVVASWVWRWLAPWYDR